MRAIFCCRAARRLRATEANKKRFEGQRAQLEARNLELREEASKVGEKLDGESVTLIRQAGETGQLYGSVSPRDIAEAVIAIGFDIVRNQVAISAPIKTIGIHSVPVQLHPEVEVHISVNVARSPQEAERQARGEEINVVEENTMDDLGLEVGAALAEAGGSFGDR